MTKEKAPGRTRAGSPLSLRLAALLTAPGFVEGRFRLAGGALDLSTASLAVEAELHSLEIGVAGDPEELEGDGHLSATLGSVSGELPIEAPLRECPSRDTSLRVHMAQGEAIEADLRLEAGEIRGEVHLGALTASFTPSYYRCEWDHRLFTQPMFNLCTRWKVRHVGFGIKTKVPEVYRSIGESRAPLSAEQAIVVTTRTVLAFRRSSVAGVQPGGGAP